MALVLHQSWCLPSQYHALKLNLGFQPNFVSARFLAQIGTQQEKNWREGLNGPQCEKTCLRRFANNKGADQPAHPRRLISATGKYHILTCYERNVTILASLCSWGDWFESRFFGNPEDRFSPVEAQIINYKNVVCKQFLCSQLGARPTQLWLHRHLPF